MARKVPFENDEYYHVYNRGVEKREIFLDDDDYSYFVHILELFNDEEPALNARFHYRSRTSISKSKIKLVEVVGYCLMPNHYHLILKQTSDAGISKYLQKLGTGFTHYFNKKYKRSGVLFQGRSKSSHIDEDKYMQYLKMYLEFNPLDLFDYDWKEKGIKNRNKAKEFLQNYKWKSKPGKDIGHELSVTNDEFLEFVNSIEVGLQ